MITVPEAANRAGRNPHTIRRWIRSGRLKARRIGAQYILDERDLEPLLEHELPLPPGWARLADGRRSPNVIRAIRLSRLGR